LKKYHDVKSITDNLEIFFFKWPGEDTYDLSNYLINLPIRYLHFVEKKARTNKAAALLGNFICLLLTIEKLVLLVAWLGRRCSLPGWLAR
jgi:hypothetical protein